MYPAISHRYRRYSDLLLILLLATFLWFLSKRATTCLFDTTESSTEGTDEKGNTASISTLSAELDECVKCPPCLQHIHSQCLVRNESRVRKHKDCTRNGKGPLCSRSVWECPDTGVFFTHPSLSSTELDSMYRNEYQGQGVLSLNHSRITAQFNFIHSHVLSNKAYDFGRNLRVLEIGCANAYLLRRLAPWSSDITCFEPSTNLASAAAKDEIMKGTNTSNLSITVHSMNWDEDRVAPESVDLFISSHVLEHVPDLCNFFTQLYGKIRPGGVIFSEVPNHTLDYVKTTFGGQFHVTLFNARGWILMMESVGFELMVIETVGVEERTMPNGHHIRAIFTKPGHPLQLSNYAKWGGISCPDC